MCKKIIKERKIEGVYGMLGDLITCPELYYTAVEVTAKNALFHFIVKDTDTADQIIK